MICDGEHQVFIAEISRMQHSAVLDLTKNIHRELNTLWERLAIKVYHIKYNT